MRLKYKIKKIQLSTGEIKKFLYSFNEAGSFFSDKRSLSVKNRKTFGLKNNGLSLQDGNIFISSGKDQILLPKDISDDHFSMILSVFKGPVVDDLILLREMSKDPISMLADIGVHGGNKHFPPKKRHSWGDLIDLGFTKQQKCVKCGIFRHKALNQWFYSFDEILKENQLPELVENPGCND